MITVYFNIIRRQGAYQYRLFRIFWDTPVNGNNYRLIIFLIGYPDAGAKGQFRVGRLEAAVALVGDRVSKLGLVFGGA